MYRNYMILPLWLTLALQAYAGQHPLDIHAGSCQSAPLNFLSNSCGILESNLPAKLSSDFQGQFIDYNESPNPYQESEPIQTAPPSQPWTKDAICMPEKNPSESYCVFSNASFASGRGISFFTAPDIAEHIARLPAFKKPELYQNANIFDDPPWEVKVIPGKGNGLFATRVLQRGDLVVAGTPVGVFQSTALASDYALGYEYLHTAFMQLPESTRHLFMSTMAHYEGDPIMERINTNAFSGEFQGSAHFLLYPETARMNHACRPNTMSTFDSSTLIHTTKASREIKVGEEITLAYMNTIQSRAARQEQLQMFWGFECNCHYCSRTADKTGESDRRIARIQTLQPDLEDWSPSSRATPRIAEELIELYEKEELHAAKGLGYALAALAYNSVGKAKEAVKFAHLALDVGLADSGIFGTEEESIVALSKNPVAHWSWNRRKGGARE